MKKIIILVLMFTININAQSITNDSININTINETERLLDKYTEKISNSFSEGVKNVTPLAEEGFKTVVKLQIAKGIINLLPFIGFLIFLILFNSEYKRIDTLLKSDNIPKHMDKNNGAFDEDNITPLCIVYLVLSIVLFIGIFFTIGSAITHLIAPEWYAVKEIINLF